MQTSRETTQTAEIPKQNCLTSRTKKTLLQNGLDRRLDTSPINEQTLTERLSEIPSHKFGGPLQKTKKDNRDSSLKPNNHDNFKSNKSPHMSQKQKSVADLRKVMKNGKSPSTKPQNESLQ